MLDLTSSLYLGMRHPSWEVTPWWSLTTGLPAALSAHPGAAAVEQDLATLQGCERSSLARSTLHVSLDVFASLAERDSLICVDSGTYPIALYGVERAQGKGAVVRWFRHHDPLALQRAVRAGPPGRVLVVTDGFCPQCGAFAPLAEYANTARAHRGLVVVDDTQALGIFGSLPGGDYGCGGGGSLRYLRLDARRFLLVASLAKAFGAPLAALSGTDECISRYLATSGMRVHCSPPSVADIRAATNALSQNRARGDSLRRRLAQTVRRFRRRLRDGGVPVGHGAFPVVTIPPAREMEPVALQRALERRGVRAFIAPGHDGRLRLGVVIRADIDLSHIDRAALALLSAVGKMRPRRGISTTGLIFGGTLPCGRPRMDVC